MQKREILENLLKSVTQARDEATASGSQVARRPKLVLKVAPDLNKSELQDVAQAVIASGGIDGVIVSNTTIQRPVTLRHRESGVRYSLLGH